MLINFCAHEGPPVTKVFPCCLFYSSIHEIYVGDGFSLKGKLKKHAIKGVGQQVKQAKAETEVRGNSHISFNLCHVS